MKLYRYLLAALIYALPTAAFAQCSGIFPAAGAVCGHATGAAGLATVLTTLPTGIQDNITRLGTIGTNVFINQNVTVAPSVPSQSPYQLRITAADGNHAHIALQSFGSDGAVSGYAASGTAAAPTALASGSTILNLTGKAWDGVEWGNSGVGNASVALIAAETQAVGAHGSFIQFATTPIGSTSRPEVARITPSGGLALGHTTDTPTGVVNPLTGFRINSTAASGALLAGNGTNFVSTATGTGVVTALGVNVGTAGAFVVNGGALGSPSSAGTMPAFTLGGTLTATGQVISGAAQVTSDVFSLLGTGGLGFMGMTGQSANPPGAPGTNNMRFFADATGRLSYQRSDGFTRTFSSAPAGDVVWTMPAVTATLLYSGGPLGTPSSGVATSLTGLPISTGLTGAGTGVLTALGINVGSAGAFTTFNGALGTPSSGTATNLTGLPLTTGVTGTLPIANGGTGVASGSGQWISPAVTVDFSIAGDNAIAIPVPAGLTRAGFVQVMISNASADISAANYGVFTTTGGGGTAILPAGSAITVTSAADNTNNNSQIVNATNISTTSYTPVSGTFQFRVGTTAASGRTAKVQISFRPMP